MTRSAIKAADRIYRARENMQMLFPDTWRKRLDEPIGIIKRVMETHDEGELEATLRIIRELRCDAEAQIIVLAAVAEMLEPTNVDSDPA